MWMGTARPSSYARPLEIVQTRRRGCADAHLHGAVADDRAVLDGREDFLIFTPRLGNTATGKPAGSGGAPNRLTWLGRSFEAKKSWLRAIRRAAQLFARADGRQRGLWNPHNNGPAVNSGRFGFVQRNGNARRGLGVDAGPASV